jgi:hypothetical protein
MTKSLWENHEDKLFASGLKLKIVSTFWVSVFPLRYEVVEYDLSIGGWSGSFASYLLDESIHTYLQIFTGI